MRRLFNKLPWRMLRKLRRYCVHETLAGVYYAGAEEAAITAASAKHEMYSRSVTIVMFASS